MLTTTPPAVRLDAVGMAYDRHAALHDVDLVVAAGALTVLAGPNGAGKSTLLEVVAGIRPPSSGRLTRATGAVAFVPQRSAVPDRLPVTVRDVVTMGAWGESGPWRRVGAGGRRRVAEAIERLGLAHLAGRPFAMLSGGERQRALLAQGLARAADLLLLDEPTTGLDTASAARVAEAIDEERARGVAVLCASHDQALIDRADHLVQLEAGRVAGD